jgi:N,N'-diacetyllegionaminate synthase
MSRRKTIIIAEIGPNHNGSISVAKKLILEAKKSGADYVKFQTYKTEEVLIKNLKKANYQINNTRNKSETQFEMLKKFELSYNDFSKLFKFCKKNKIKFLTTAFDLESIDFVNQLNLDFFKIPSGEINNLLFLRKIGKFNKKIILSTGMSNMKEINYALKILIKSGTKKKNITILHCNSEYPTPFKDANLKAIESMKKKLKVSVGYSDHTLGIEAPIAAVAFGAKIIEKHFTLNKNMKGPDHKVSLEPKEFKLMVCSIRNIEIAIGDGIKKVAQSEKKNIFLVRRAIVARKKILKGEYFDNNNLTIKRPANGKSPILWDSLIGKKSKKNYFIDDKI